jgi:ankyrin repeat protein
VCHTHEALTGVREISLPAALPTGGYGIAVRWIVGLCLLVVSLCGCAEASDEDPATRAAAVATPSRALVYLAADRGDAADLGSLLADGGDPDASGPGNRSAITAAAYGGHVEVVRLLLEAGADVNAQDDSRANPLLSTGETGNVEVLRVLLAANPDLARTNRFGGTALIPAADRGHVEVVRALITTGMDIDHVNNLGWTALLEAIILGEGGHEHTEIVGLLIDSGADVNLGDGAGVRPLSHARQRGFSGIARLLEAAGAR